MGSMRRRPGWLSEKWQFDAKATRVARKAADILYNAKNHLMDSPASWEPPCPPCPTDMTPAAADAVELLEAANQVVDRAHEAAQAAAKARS